MTGGGFSNEFDRPKKAPRPIEYIDVPNGTLASQCQAQKRGGSCTATVYWIERPSRAKNAPPGKVVRIPVDCDYNEECREPNELPSPFDDGYGVNHFQTCPDANRF